MNISVSLKNNTELSQLNSQIRNGSNQDNVNKKQKHSKNSINNKNNTGNSLKIRKNGVLEGLIKQKSNLMDIKKSIMESASKTNEDPKVTKEKIEEVDKQIEEIDKQISKLQIEDQRKAFGTEDKDKKTKKEANKASTNDTQKNQSSVELNNILSLSGKLEEAANIASQKKLKTGELRVLECEIKIDKLRGVDTTKKEKRSVELKENIEKIDGEIGKALGNVNNKIKKNIESNSKDIDINGNKETQDTKNGEDIELSNKLFIKHRQDLHNIKQYDDNKDDKDDKENGEKIDVTA